MMNEDLVAKLRAVRVRTPEEVMAQYDHKFSAEDILRGRTFLSDAQDSDNNYIGLRVALQEAVEYVGEDGIIASLPYLIAGKAQADKSNYLWQDWFAARSEEHVVVDTHGQFTSAGRPLVIVVHGQGIFTPDRIQQAYDDGLTPQNAAKLRDSEARDLLEGKLPDGRTIQLYTVDDVKKGTIPEPFGQYGVVVDFETARGKPSGWHKKEDFMNNEMVIARAGTLEHLNAYFEKAKHTDGTVGNWHQFTRMDATRPQGRVLSLYNDYGGLNGIINLNLNGRFVGVRYDE